MKGNIIDLSGHLLAEGLISQDNFSDLSYQYVGEPIRAATLVQLVQMKVFEDHQNYNKFTAILERDSEYYRSILKTLKEKYSQLQGKMIKFLHTINLIAKYFM